MDIQIIWNLIAMGIMTIQGFIIHDLIKIYKAQQKQIEGLRSIVMGEDE